MQVSPRSAGAWPAGLLFADTGDLAEKPLKFTASSLHTDGGPTRPCGIPLSSMGSDKSLTLRWLKQN